MGRFLPGPADSSGGRSWDFVSLFHCLGLKGNSCTSSVRKAFLWLSRWFWSGAKVQLRIFVFSQRRRKYPFLPGPQGGLAAPRPVWSDGVRLGPSVSESCLPATRHRPGRHDGTGSAEGLEKVSLVWGPQRSRKRTQRRLCSPCPPVPRGQAAQEEARPAGSWSVAGRSADGAAHKAVFELGTQVFLSSLVSRSTSFVLVIPSSHAFRSLDSFTWTEPGCGPGRPHPPAGVRASGRSSAT